VACDKDEMAQEIVLGKHEKRDDLGVLSVDGRKSLVNIQADFKMIWYDGG
jgi:hypothetical protein